MANSNLPAIKQICDTIGQMAGTLQEVLPPGMDLQRFIATAKNMVQTHPQQDKLESADRRTLFLAVQSACASGLLLDGREAIITIRGGKAVFEPMTQGMVKQAMNSGKISKIDIEVVYANDQFRYRPGIDDQPVFEPDWKMAPSKRGDPVLAYAVIAMNDGSFITRILHAERILQIASATPNKGQYQVKSPHFTEWWRKTVLRNALKYAPKSSAIDMVLKSSDEAFAGVFDIDDIDVGGAAKDEKPAAKKTTRAAKKILEGQVEAPPKGGGRPEVEDAQTVDEDTGEVSEADEDIQVPI